MIDPNISPPQSIWGYLLYVIFGIVGFFFKDFLSKKTDADKEIKMAEIAQGTKEYESLKKDLHKALDDAKILKEDLRKSREKTQEISQKFEAVKTGYRIIFKQYAMTFKDDPEQLTMLEELNSIINE
mgnify:CR=1 FL=1